MTIKELAEFTGRDIRTVRRWIAKAGDKVSQAPHDTKSQGIAHDYSIKEVAHILDSSSMSKDAVGILMENAMNKDVPQQQVDYEVIGKMIGMAVSAAMQPVVNQLQNINKPLQIEQPKQDYFSLVGYCSLHKIKTTNSELKKMGMDLRKIAKSQGKELHKIPDERYGQVNSYPVEILEEYFSE